MVFTSFVLYNYYYRVCERDDTIANSPCHVVKDNKILSIRHTINTNMPASVCYLTSELKKLLFEVRVTRENGRVAL